MWVCVIWSIQQQLPRWSRAGVRRRKRCNIKRQSTYISSRPYRELGIKEVRNSIEFRFWMLPRPHSFPVELYVELLKRRVHPLVHIYIYKEGRTCICETHLHWCSLREAVATQNEVLKRKYSNPRIRVEGNVYGMA